jgi:hypothetical protein
MAFIAESITAFYDKEQDRLSLIFSDKDKKQLLGMMTRQFFKDLLIQLTNWLPQQYTDSISRTAEQQWEINHFHYLLSQQKVTVTYEKIQPDHQIPSFLISILNFTKGRSGDADKIKLEFLDSRKTTEIILVLNPAQLHKLIGETLKQVQAWDIDHPWQQGNKISASLILKDRVIH